MMKLIPFLFVALAGCVSSPSQRLSSTHPANADAPQTPYMTEHNGLLAATNSTTVATNPVTTSDHEHEHEKPKTK